MIVKKKVMKKLMILFVISLLSISLNGLFSVHALRDGGNANHLMGIPTRKGEYATGGTGGEYPDEAEMEWLSKFKIVHAGNIEEPLLPDDMAYLRQNGVKIIMADDWLPAGYYYPDGNNTPFMEWVYENRYEVTLNPDGPFPHCEENGYDWREYYFDFARDEMVNHRVGYIVNGLKSAGYDGIFFDWGNGLFLEEEGYETINATYNSRHPGIPYSQAAANFLAELRDAYPGLVMENNQGFREAEYYLPVLDYDMTESYVTSDGYYGKKLYVEGYGLTEVPQTVYYPVSDSEFTGSLNDTLYYLNYLAELRNEYGGEHFKKTVYMNYAAPEFVFAGRENGHDVYRPAIPKNAIYFGYAVAKLVNQISYTEVPWNHTCERCDVYFYDLGEPLGSNYEKVDGGYVRYYSNGFVVAGEWKNEADITLHLSYILSNSDVYDALEGKWIKTGNGEVTIAIKPEMDNLTGRASPSGRVFIYPENESLQVRITRPEAGKLYLMDREIMAVGGNKTIAIGGITIEANTNGDKVEFYVDDKLRFTDEEAPYSWTWNELAAGMHEIKVVAYDDKGNEVKDEVTVIIFNI